MNKIIYKVHVLLNLINICQFDRHETISLFAGHRRDFLLPDRNKYVSMDRHFLKSYMDLVVQTCHQRGCHATGGMAALLLPEMPAENYSKYQEIQDKVLR